jgi:hypothetical protein
MSLSLLVDPRNAAVPLDLTITQEGVGGVTGQTPTVALRDGSTLNSYLDFSDSTFKTSGWTQKYAPLTEVEKGHYQRLLSMPALVPVPVDGKAYVAEYELNSGVGKGVDHDVLLVASVTDVVLLRKGLTNRLEEAPGFPGTLVLYDDDGVTPLLNWTLRDASGGPVVGAVGAPARRSAAT